VMILDVQAVRRAARAWWPSRAPQVQFVQVLLPGENEDVKAEAHMILRMESSNRRPPLATSRAAPRGFRWCAVGRAHNVIAPMRQPTATVTERVASAKFSLRGEFRAEQNAQAHGARLKAED